MRALQKEALFCLIVTGTTFALIAVAVLVIRQFFPGLNPVGAAGFGGFLGLLGLTPLFYRKSRGGDEVVIDERDIEIKQRAGLQAYSVFWVCFVITCVLPGVLNGWQGSVSYLFLAIMPLAGMAIFQIVRSISILLQYRAG